MERKVTAPQLVCAPDITTVIRKIAEQRAKLEELARLAEGGDEVVALLPSPSFVVSFRTLPLGIRPIDETKNNPPS